MELRHVDKKCNYKTMSLILRKYRAFPISHHKHVLHHSHQLTIKIGVGMRKPTANHQKE